ncbi:unnamed protein product [Orchesella dallaii]|uniref:Carboxylic ester hydrolase n=1 Tax=Orchesella dallaii TaxID=48710 RepID=A0ABP1RSE5_9HEXA
MFARLSIILINLFCTLYKCEFGANPPYLFTNPQDSPLIHINRLLPLPLDDLNKEGRSLDEEHEDDRGPRVITKLGPVQGFKMGISDTREVFAFTGVPYGETTSGENRFRAPLPRKAWPGLWDATLPSPLCLQSYPFANWRVRGQDDCLYLDIYTPHIPQNGSRGELLPVFLLIPGGAFFFGDSRSYGPEYLLRENIIFIPINVRMGIFGWLSTGDEHASGNWALKDQALAIEWVHDNIQAFGGDPDKIIIGGVSSGAMSAHAMLFTNHRARSYVKGIVAISGTTVPGPLNTQGKVQDISDAAAKTVGCPTSKDMDGSKRMVECLRNVNPLVLANHARFMPYFISPAALFMPTLESPGPSAFISELPQLQYSKGIVPPIPLIVTRTEDETQMELLSLRRFLSLTRHFYFNMMTLFLSLVYGNSFNQVDTEQARKSFAKVHQFYFGKSSPPDFMIGTDYSIFCQILNDAVFIAPMWTAVEYHHKVAPTYTYIQKTKVLPNMPLLKLLGRGRLTRFGASHAVSIK